MTDPGQTPEGIPIVPFIGGEQQRPPGTPIRPGDRPGPATAREMALEDAIQTIKGCNTMAELKAAGIDYELRTATWQTEIDGFDYGRPTLREIIELIRHGGPREETDNEKEQDDGRQ